MWGYVTCCERAQLQPETRPVLFIYRLQLKGWNRPSENILLDWSLLFAAAQSDSWLLMEVGTGVGVSVHTHSDGHASSKIIYIELWPGKVAAF